MFEQGTWTFPDRGDPLYEYLTRCFQTLIGKSQELNLSLWRDGGSVKWVWFTPIKAHLTTCDILSLGYSVLLERRTVFTIVDAPVLMSHFHEE